jgi:hypothetical protein
MDNSQSDNIGGGSAITGLVSEANFECSETGIVSYLFNPPFPVLHSPRLPLFLFYLHLLVSLS